MRAFHETGHFVKLGISWNWVLHPTGSVTRHDTYKQALRVTLAEEEQTDVALMSSHLAATLLNYDGAEDRREVALRAARWTKMLTWAEINFVMMPVHYGGNHWYVLVWNRLRGVLEMYDSMRGPNENFPRNYTQNMLDVFRDWVDCANAFHARKSRGLRPMEKQAALPTRVENCSRLVFQQRDGHNCGVRAPPPSHRPENSRIALHHNTTTRKNNTTQHNEITTPLNITT